MWEPRRLTTLWAFTPYYTDSFIFLIFFITDNYCNRKSVYEYTGLIYEAFSIWNWKGFERKRSLYNIVKYLAAGTGDYHEKPQPV
jgi:hypothetical protein